MGLVVAFFFQSTVEEVIGQNASLGQPIAAPGNFKIDPPIDVFHPSKPVLQDKLFWNVCDFDMDVLGIFHWRFKVEIFDVNACKPCTLPRDDTLKHEFIQFQLCCVGARVAGIANEVTPNHDTCAVFIIFTSAYSTHHLCVDDLFSFVVWDVGIHYDVEGIGACNPFSTSFVSCANTLA